MVLEKVKMILSNQFDVEEDAITPETNIADDLGAGFSGRGGYAHVPGR